MKRLTCGLVLAALFGGVVAYRMLSTPDGGVDRAQPLAIFAQDFSRFDEVRQKPLVHEDVFELFPILEPPLQHLPHEKEKEPLVLAL